MFEELFRSLCESAVDSACVLGTEFKADNRIAVFTMFRRMIKLELVFKRRSIGGVNNVLYCRVYPNKITTVYYLMPELFVELDIPEYRSVFFSMIENEERFRACFDQLFRIIEERLPEIESAADEGRLPWVRKVSDDGFLERRMVFSDYAASREPFVILDYTRKSAYRALLNGNLIKTVRIIERGRARGRTLEYQNRLCEHIKSSGLSFSPMPDECNAVRDDDLAEKKDLTVYLVCCLVSLFALSAFFFSAKLLFDLFFTRGTVAVFGAPWYFCFILGAVPSLFGAIVFRKRLVKLFFPKRAKSMLERDEVKNGKSVDRLAGVALVPAAAFAVFAFIMIAFSGVRVYGDRLDAASDGSVFIREEYMYSDIKEICRISARYNIYGERIDRSSYVLIMNDGRVFDLDAALSERQTEDVLLPLFSGYSIPLSELDSDRDIENGEKTE